MTPREWMLAMQIAFGVMLFYTCFCRLTKTSERTSREIRWAIWLEGVAALMIVLAPALPALMPEFHGDSLFHWKPGRTPKWAWLFLLASATLVQLVTARFWHDGPPPPFQKGQS